MKHWPRRVLILLVRAYQLCLSPWLPPACRFQPSCSHYAMEALERHGALRGLKLTLWRLARCQPFATGGYDPVPETPCRQCRPPNPRARSRMPVNPSVQAGLTQVQP